MTNITLYSLFVLSLFGAGFVTSYQLYHSQVTALELQIKVSNEEAQHLLVDATEKVEAANAAALVTNTHLEIEYDKNIKLNNDLSNSLTNVRMRVTTKHSNCSNPLPASTGSIAIAGSTNTTELPEDFERLLRSETLRADNLAVYANEAFNFIKANCGIKP